MSITSTNVASRHRWRAAWSAPTRRMRSATDDAILTHLVSLEGKVLAAVSRVREAITYSGITAVLRVIEQGHRERVKSLVHLCGRNEAGSSIVSGSTQHGVQQTAVQLCGLADLLRHLCRWEAQVVGSYLAALPKLRSRVRRTIIAKFLPSQHAAMAALALLSDFPDSDNAA